MNESEKNRLHVAWEMVSEVVMELARLYDMDKNFVNRDEKSFIKRAITSLNEAQEFLIETSKVDPQPEFKVTIRPEQFAKDMQEIIDEHSFSAEVSHHKFDNYVCDLLREWGFGEGVDIIENSTRWYA